MKFLLSMFVFFNILFAEMNVYEMFQKQYYTKICLNRWKYINEYKDREDIFAIVAYSCLKKNFLVPALDLAKVMYRTKEGRKNATYISTLFLIKKILIQLINGDIDKVPINVPKIDDNLLGILYNEIQSGNFTRKNSTIEIKKDKTYVLSVTKDGNIQINIYKDSTLIKTESYW